tara:strand:+ start:162 stop:452 length:291 start_codon:yes stop_codon:yes gene_type:complete
MLKEVIDIVDNKRNAEYGDPMDVIDKTAKMFELYLDAPWRGKNQFVALDVVAFNEIQKIVRKSFNPLHEDSYKDIAGYASIGFEKVQQIKRNQHKK